MAGPYQAVTWLDSGPRTDVCNCRSAQQAWRVHGPVGTGSPGKAFGGEGRWIEYLDLQGVSCLEVPDRGGLGRNQPGDPDRSRCWYTLSLKQTPLSLRLACHSVPEPAASAANWVHLIPWDPWMMVSDVLVDRLIQVM